MSSKFIFKRGDLHRSQQTEIIFTDIVIAQVIRDNSFFYCLCHWKHGEFITSLFLIPAVSLPCYVQSLTQT